MVALNESISEPGLRREARGCRVAATYPQGGTGMPTGAVPMVNNLFQGMPLDPATGLYYERARWYSPSLGTWVSQDPAGYINGANTYQFVESDPVGKADPDGLRADYSHPLQGRYKPRSRFTYARIAVANYNSMLAEIHYRPGKPLLPPCKCRQIAIVQYVKDTSSAGAGGISLAGVPYALDGGFPYGGANPSPKIAAHWPPVAILKDSPSTNVVNGQFPWLHVGNAVVEQRLFEARDVAVCLAGSEKGDYYGALTWGFYESWLGDTLATVHVDGHSSTGPIVQGKGRWPKNAILPLVQAAGLAPKP